jgi:thiosulfate sulfurtransferase
MLKPKQITIGELEQLLKTANPLVLDARDAPSYRAGHMDGAMLLHDDLMAAIIKRRELDRAVILYCYRGNLSLEKGALFCAAGFRNVCSLAGGYVAWMKRDTTVDTNTAGTTAAASNKTAPDSVATAS